MAPALGLSFLSPLVAEWLLGNQSISQLASLFVLAPMYGGGALLIRELVRLHRFALAAGATLTYAWLGFTQPPLDGASGTVHRLGNALCALAAVALLATAARTARRTREGEANRICGSV